MTMRHNIILAQVLFFYCLIGLCHTASAGTPMSDRRAKAVNEIEMERAERVICLLPARTDTAWWHRYVLPFAAEIHYLRGRIRFEGAGSSAPFPSAVVIFEKRHHSTGAFGLPVETEACP